jgi:hypothetical protein
MRFGGEKTSVGDIHLRSRYPERDIPFTFREASGWRIEASDRERLVYRDADDGSTRKQGPSPCIDPVAEVTEAIIG